VDVSIESHTANKDEVDVLAVGVPDLPGAVVVSAILGAVEAKEPLGWAALHASERDYAGTRPGRRRCEFVAGRCALRKALRQLGWDGNEPLLPGPQGRPYIPPGFTGSLTHKAGVALAIASRSPSGATLGIDCEVIGDRERSGIARKVLLPAELDRWQSEGSTWSALLEAFSTKEAIYKALHPHVPRYIGFEEAEVLANGEIQMHLVGGEGPFRMTRHLHWSGERLVVVVEAGLLGA